MMLLTPLPLLSLVLLLWGVVVRVGVLWSSSFISSCRISALIGLHTFN